MQKADLISRFGIEVRRRRRHLGLSQEELAERAALHRTYVSDVESGRRNVSLENIQRLARALGSSMGAIFSAVDLDPEPPASVNGPPAAVSLSNILLVEDNPADVQLTLAAFEEAKLANHIDVVHDGAEALDFILCQRDYIDRRFQDRPLVVLLDLQLPKVEGIEVLRRVRADERHRKTPVIVLTASRKDQHIQAALQLGADGYIVKPVDFQSFSLIVPQLSLRWALLHPNLTALASG